VRSTKRRAIDLALVAGRALVQFPLICLKGNRQTRTFSLRETIKTQRGNCESSCGGTGLSDVPNSWKRERLTTFSCYGHGCDKSQLAEKCHAMVPHHVVRASRPDYRRRRFPHPARVLSRSWLIRLPPQASRAVVFIKLLPATLVVFGMRLKLTRSRSVGHGLGSAEQVRAVSNIPCLVARSRTS
jgi:hypothetical protein